jgi:hypothetical protein
MVPRRTRVVEFVVVIEAPTAVHVRVAMGMLVHSAVRRLAMRLKGTVETRSCRECLCNLKNGAMPARIYMK